MEILGCRGQRLCPWSDVASTGCRFGDAKLHSSDAEPGFRQTGLYGVSHALGIAKFADPFVL